MCHPDYAASQICDQIKGNCSCKNPTITLSDRTCGRCIRGYGDFPYCKGKLFTHHNPKTPKTAIGIIRDLNTVDYHDFLSYVMKHFVFQ